MGDQFQHIRDPSDLETLSVWRLVPSRMPPPIVLGREGAPAWQIRRWEDDLRRLQTACGCEQGAAGLIAGIAAYLFYLLLRPGGWGDPGTRELWIGLGVVVATSSAGKLVGLLAAHRRLKRAVREIQSHWRLPAGAQPVSDATAVEAERDEPVPAPRCCGRSSRRGRRTS